MKKKLLALLLVALMIIGAVAPIALAGVPTSVVQLPDGTKSIYVRSGPGTNYARKGSVADGQEVDLLSIGKTWTRIRVLSKNLTGYVKNVYIESLPETMNRDIAIAAHVGNCTSAYLHTGPGTSTPHITALGKDTKMKVWGNKDNWSYITTLGTGKTGWIYRQYVVDGFTQVTTTKVHFRHSENGSVISTLKKGTKVNVISIDDAWSEVNVNGTIGYVYTKYLK